MMKNQRMQQTWPMPSIISLQHSLENYNIQQIEKGVAISVLKDSFSRNSPSIKIIPITEADIKSTVHSLKPKKSSGYYEITRKILQACASLISHPLTLRQLMSYIYIWSAYS